MDTRTYGERLRGMPAGRAARALWRLIGRESWAIDRHHASAPSYIGELMAAWDIDRELPVVAARFVDGSAVAIRCSSKDL